MGWSSAHTRAPWHTLSVQQVLDSLETTEHGLNEDEADRRQAELGPNVLLERVARPAWRRFLEQFKSPLIYVLLVAAALSFFIGERWDPYVILGIVLINSIIGYFQESRAEQALAALRRMTSPRAKVLRDGHVRELPASAVVVGDVLELEAGDRVAADARILHAHELSIDESALTGESLPVSKHSRALDDPTPPLGDRANMAYMNTNVTAGRAHAVVVATGMATEMGAIATEVAGVESLSPLQRQFEGLSRLIGLVVLVLVTGVLALGILKGLHWAEMVVVALSLAVSAIPEGLPIVVSVLLAIGVWRMARRKALVRHLPAVEALGSATVICSDKTGTLTKNEMTVQALYVGGAWVRVTGEGYRPQGELIPRDHPPGPESLRLLLAGAALCNDAILEERDGGWGVVGDPTEGALQALALKAGFMVDWPRVEEIPFSSDRRWMATLHERPDGSRVGFVKGAIEALFDLAGDELDGQGTARPLDREHWSACSEAMAQEALRVLAIGVITDPPEAGFACLPLSGRVSLVGLVGMRDPERPEAVRAVETAQQAGIRVVMITGDHRSTAEAIARRLGLLQAGHQVIDGLELDRLNDAELERAIGQLAVFARVSPSHKLRIVQALQAAGEIVAMTGDGVNDAPALAQADIGIAMGLAGTEVAKGAADMVLVDDNFATIVVAVQEGRGITANLRKVLMYLLATNAGEILALSGAVALGLPLPVTAVQILWLNLVTDGTIDKAFAAEPPESSLMRERPQRRGAPLLTARMLARIGFMAAVMASASLLLLVWELSLGATIERARSMAFTTLAATQWASALAFRSADKTLFQMGVASNLWLLGGIALSVLLQAMVLYSPPMQAIFGTVPLSLAEAGRCVAVAFLLLVISEVSKLLKWAMR